MYVSCAGGYCAEVSPLALRGITTAAVNLWIDRKSVVYFLLLIPTNTFVVGQL